MRKTCGLKITDELLGLVRRGIAVVVHAGKYAKIVIRGPQYLAARAPELRAVGGVVQKLIVDDAVLTPHIEGDFRRESIVDERSRGVAATLHQIVVSVGEFSL